MVDKVGARVPLPRVTGGDGIVDGVRDEGKQSGTIVVLATTARAAVWYADQARLHH